MKKYTEFKNGYTHKRRKKIGKIKYPQEFKDETARFTLENGKSACSVAAELNIDKNQVRKWVKQYREKNNLPSYEEENP